MTTDNKQYCLKWNHFSDNILNSLESLRGDEDFVDVTIACEGQSFKAHKVVLSACSQYIKKLLKENPCAHPIIILKDVSLPEFKALLSFMYNGQVMVEESQIPKLLRTAELLEIRGLSDLSNVSQQPVNKESLAWGDSSDEDHEYDDEYDDEEEDDDDDENQNTTPLPTDFSNTSTEHKQNRDLQVTSVDPIMYSRNKHEEISKCLNLNNNDSIMNGHDNNKDCPLPNRPIIPTNGQRASDFAARVSQMEENILPGDVLVIGETHITPARCVPRPMKPPHEEAPPAKQQCFGAESPNDNRLSLEMSLRYQVQRKLEAERIRAMERLRQAEAAAYNEQVLQQQNNPIDCTNFQTALTNGIHNNNNNIHHNNHHSERDELNAQQSNAVPPQPPPPLQAAPPPQQQQQQPPQVPTISLPLSPDLQLKMLMCRDFKKYTNMLLVAVFGREVLATHCLNGSKGSAKPRLDTEKVTRVIATVMEKFDVPASTVREAIRVKLNNEDKLKKRSKRSTHPLL